jgi:hypothetical protein
MIAAGKAQLRRILEAYALYCSNMRGYWSLAKDTSASRSIERVRSFVSKGLEVGHHHHYV